MPAEEYDLHRPDTLLPYAQPQRYRPGTADQSAEPPAHSPFSVATCSCPGEALTGFCRNSGSPASPAGLKQCRRSEEHTSELQSRPHLVCRLLLEKKKK